MRDGIVLSTDVYLPDGSGRSPTVLIRTCYTKTNVPYTDRAAYWTSHGFVFVVQDVRGRGDSDGIFYPLVDETLDGADTLDWIVDQSWSDGRVVMIGGSYLGWTQLYAACALHPALVAVVPAVTPPDPNRHFPTSHGLISPAAGAWLAMLDGHTNQDLDINEIRGAYAVRPIIDFDRHLGRNLKPWRDWVEHGPGDIYWQKQAYQEKLLKSSIPMLHITGWYDDCLVGATENFVNMTRRAHNPEARERQRLIIGPWGHPTIGQRSLAEIDFGPEAEVDVSLLQRTWFDAVLSREGDSSSPVRVFVMGRNAWMEEQEWPIARTVYTPLYLYSAGKANGRLGDGQLSLTLPGDQPPDRFRYDPANPIPYDEKFNTSQVGGPDDFATIELREDILVYTGPVLEEPLLICGPITVRLFAASSALDTDWTAKILDVYPDGRAIRLNDGAVRARFRRGMEHEELLTPGKAEEYLIDCWSTCIELAPGHRLRLEIASSAYGKYDVNLNGGGAVGRETGPVIAEQTVFHDRARPSHILVPVVPA